MKLFDRYRLEKEGDEYTLVLYLNPNTTEFSAEPGYVINSEENSIGRSVKSFVRDTFPDIKIKAARVFLGSSLLTVLPTKAFEPVDEVPASSTSTGHGCYVVVEGDTLVSVSEKTKVSAADIKNFNQLSKDIIFPNQVLKIPSTAHIRIFDYTITDKDSLKSICEKFRITTDSVKKANNLKIDRIRTGQKLLVSVPLL